MYILTRNCISRLVSRKYSCIFRSCSTSTLKISDTKDLYIPMSYGKLAAKTWGSETGYPILAFHGWLDNCGTFDNLMPLLKSKFYVVAIDAPGHGLSSHKPHGCLYTDYDAIRDYRKVVEFLGWKSFCLLGHSYGAAIALSFANLYPKLVKKVVALDLAKPVSAPLQVFPHVIANALDEVLELEKKVEKPPPVYTLEAAALRLRKGMYNEVTPEGIQVLLKRGSVPSPCGKGVIFSRDLRCRPIEHISVRTHELVFHCMSSIQCELLLLMATNTHPNYKSDEPEILKQIYEIYQKNAKKFVLENVEGNHFVHLNNPECIAPHINSFLAN